MCPRGALCGCCENTLLWDVQMVLYCRWTVGRSRLASYYEGKSSGVVWESVDFLLSCQCVTADFIRSSVGVYDSKTGVVLDGWVRRTGVVDPWRSCGSGCFCVHTAQRERITHFHHPHPRHSISIPVSSFRSYLASLIDHDQPTAGYIYIYIYIYIYNIFGEKWKG